MLIARMLTPQTRNDVDSYYILIVTVCTFKNVTLKWAGLVQLCTLDITNG